MARVPYIRREDLKESQQGIYDNIAKTRGKVSNVFSALLNNPEATKAVTTVGEYIRYNSNLDPIIRETAILTTANEMNNGYEWAQHEPIAREVGVRDEVIDSILSGKGPMGLPAKEGIFIQSAKELVKNGTVTSRTYQALEHLLGPKVAIDFLVTVGYYSMLSRLIHSLDVDFDEGLTLNDRFKTD